MKKFRGLFESFVEDQVEQTLTSGQRAALSRGHDLVTKSQHALCYLIAKGKKSVLRQPYNKFDSNSELVAHAGLNPETAKHRVIEYEVLMGKKEPRAGDEHLINDRESELIHHYFNSFENMDPYQVAELADESFTPENQEIGMSKLMDQRNKQKASQTKTKMNRQQEDNSIKNDIKFNVNGYRAMNKAGEGMSDLVIKKVAAKYGIPEAHVRKLYNEV